MADELSEIERRVVVARTLWEDVAPRMGIVRGASWDWLSGDRKQPWLMDADTVLAALDAHGREHDEASPQSDHKRVSGALDEHPQPETHRAPNPLRSERAERMRMRDRGPQSDHGPGEADEWACKSCGGKVQWHPASDDFGVCSECGREQSAPVSECEAHEIIAAPHCPICLIEERDRLQVELDEARAALGVQEERGEEGVDSDSRRWFRVQCDHLFTLLDRPAEAREFLGWLRERLPDEEGV